MTEIEHPFVTVVIPVLNEEEFILPLLQSLGCLDGDRCLPGPHEVIVVDGGSTDRTLEILSGIAADAGIRVLSNPRRLQSAGVNLAAREANPQSRYLVRIDAHAFYEPGYVRKVVRALLGTEAHSVVVPLVTRPDERKRGFVWSVTAAQRSILGSGGAIHRSAKSHGQWIDHGHHAGFDLGFFLALGGYDEAFAVNEDAEYDIRVIRAGGRIWFEPTATAWYSPRATAVALARQYFRYGRGRAMTFNKHGGMPKVRQLFPVFALVANLASMAGALASPSLLLVPGLYFATCLVVATRSRVALGIKDNGYVDEEAACALVIMHMCWAVGFACNVVPSKVIIFKRSTASRKHFQK